MKKFNQLFKEEAPASDYKREKDSEDEVKDIAPRSKEEEDFVTKHKVNKIGHPVAPDEQHTGDRPKGKKGKAGADHKGADEKGEPILKTYKDFTSKIKEEVELIDEAFKKGSLKLKSGESVDVDEATAKMLNNALGQLSGSNKKRMETEAMKDKKSFEAMVKFAKAAA
jgi:hypothetical protein